MKGTIVPLPEFSNPDTLLDPPGPYSQVVRVGDLVFVSGQVGSTNDGVLVGPGVNEQCDQALRNIGLALESVGLTLDHVAKVSLYVAYPEDMGSLVPHMDESFPNFFTNGFPASTLTIVQRLFDPGFRIEIDAIAHA
ncbi:RidA family protein [Microbacterium maritypicum]|uniref:RidA family protein n=1 Tax=Microbacterium maritypicum TaxID=33918 RepID=UPI0038209476